jgi:hypothetical protein
MALPLSKTMLQVLHALAYANRSHGTPGPKQAGVVAMYASMGKQIDRTLPALAKRGYAQRIALSTSQGLEDCWEATLSGQKLLDDLRAAAEALEARRDKLVIGPRSRLSPLAARVAG